MQLKSGLACIAVVPGDLPTAACSAAFVRAPLAGTPRAEDPLLRYSSLEFWAGMPVTPRVCLGPGRVHSGDSDDSGATGWDSPTSVTSHLASAPPSPPPPAPAALSPFDALLLAAEACQGKPAAPVDCSLEAAEQPSPKATAGADQPAFQMAAPMLKAGGARQPLKRSRADMEAASLDAEAQALSKRLRLLNVQLSAVLRLFGSHMSRGIARPRRHSLPPRPKPAPRLAAALRLATAPAPAPAPAPARILAPGLPAGSLERFLSQLPPVEAAELRAARAFLACY